MDNKDNVYKDATSPESGSYNTNQNNVFNNTASTGSTNTGNNELFGDAYNRVMNEGYNDINSLNNDMMSLKIDEQNMQINSLSRNMQNLTNSYEKKLKSTRRWRTVGCIISLGLGLAVGALVSAAVVSRYLYNTDNAWVVPKKTGEDKLSSKIADKVDSIDAIIDSRYLEDYKEDDLESYIYKGMIAGLGDPYSTYYTAQEYKDMLESTNGKYKGIGVYVSQDPNTKKITVADVMEDGPAKEAGIIAGDVIIKVDGEDVTQMDINNVTAKIKGEEGKPVRITVIRTEKEEEKELEFNVDRREIEVKTIKYEMLADKVGYIQITEFEETTIEQFKNAITDLKKQGMTGLVVDLRDNPGGLLNAVSDMLDYILPEGLTVYTQDKYGNKDEYKSDAKTELDVPMTVLINGNSASASEIFAGAVQDYGVGKLVGEKSFGKGIVQEIRPLSDGSAVKLTISKYYTPKGRCIHKTGIAPDVEIVYDKEAMGDKYDKAKDNQLKKAVDEVKAMSDK